MVAVRVELRNAALFCRVGDSDRWGANAVLCAPPNLRLPDHLHHVADHDPNVPERRYLLARNALSTRRPKSESRVAGYHPNACSPAKGFLNSVLDRTARIIVPNDLSVRSDDEFEAGHIWNIQGGKCIASAISVGPFDLKLGQVGFDLCSLSLVIHRDSDEYDFIGVFLVDLDEARRRLAARASPIGPTVNDHDLARSRFWRTVDPAFRRNLWSSRANAKRAHQSRIGRATTEEHPRHQNPQTQYVS